MKHEDIGVRLRYSVLSWQRQTNDSFPDTPQDRLLIQSSAPTFKMPHDPPSSMAAMTRISLNLPKDLSNCLDDLAKTSGQTASHLAMDVLRDYIEHEKTLTAQIELAIEEADQGKLAADDQVAGVRARCWIRNTG